MKIQKTSKDKTTKRNSRQIKDLTENRQLEHHEMENKSGAVRGGGAFAAFAVLKFKAHRSNPTK